MTRAIVLVVLLAGCSSSSAGELGRVRMTDDAGDVDELAGDVDAGADAGRELVVDAGELVDVALCPPPPDARYICMEPKR